MQKVLYVVLAIIGIGGYLYVKRHHHAAADPRADDDHPVHIAMGGHDFVIPRYFLVVSPGDDAKLQTMTIQPAHGHGPPSVRIASFDLLAALPGFTPVAAATRDAPYGNVPDDKIRLTLSDQPAPLPVTLSSYASDLQKRNINYTSEPGPYGLTQEDDEAAKSKVPAHHYFGALYGGQLMITCVDATGLACSFTYPLDNATLTVSFARVALPQWSSLYPAAVKFMVGFRRG